VRDVPACDSIGACVFDLMGAYVCSSQESGIGGTCFTLHFGLSCRFEEPLKSIA